MTIACLPIKERSPRDNPKLGRMFAAQIGWALSRDSTITGRNGEEIKIHSRDKVVLINLIKHANRVEGWCHRSLKEMSEDTALCPSSISRSTKYLHDAGLIDAEQVGKQQKKFYVVNWPDFFR